MSEPRQITDSETNPLLKAWVTPFAAPPFNEIKPEHFLPAFEQAFADHSAEIAAITNDPAAPDFANTITAQERSGKLLSKVAAGFLIPDNHLGRATVSSVAVAHEVQQMGGRSVACINARDRNVLGNQPIAEFLEQLAGVADGRRFIEQPVQRG